MSNPTDSATSRSQPWSRVQLDDLLPQARTENFPVASRLLPRRERAHLFAIYAYARLVDDVGDEYEGDRLAALDELERELDRAYEGRATHPVFVRLQTSIEECTLPRPALVHLIEANRRDQIVDRYHTFDELVGYCTLSANPVGRLVLRVFDADTDEHTAWSDDVCTALQIVEHLQDVGEDAQRGRVYLPLTDLVAAGCGDADLTAASASPALRLVVAKQAARCRGLLASGRPLVRSLGGRAGLAVAGFTAGGLAALDAIAAVDHDVLAHRCRPRRARLIRHAVGVRAGRRRGAP
jgi:squalene synthase HpnC